MNSDIKLTIDDVADALGVSKTTVSRAISGKGRIGKETKQRVLEFIEEHNYRPNSIAKSLASKRTYNIGVVWPEDYNAVDLPFFQRCMIGVNEITSGFGYDLLVSFIVDNDISSLKRVIENNKVDGIILTRTLHDDRPAEYLKKSRIPFVTIGSPLYEDVPHVDNDNFDACKELTNILVGKGMHRLGLIGGPKNHVITETRYKGFMAGYEAAGVKPDDSLIFLDVISPRTISSILKELLRKHADGVICMDDSIAGEVLACCRDAHIKIPDDLKLASFYDSSILQNATPPITSLNFNDKNLGAAAARTLIDIINGETPQNILLKDYEVILKESTK